MAQTMCKTRLVKALLRRTHVLWWLQQNKAVTSSPAAPAAAKKMTVWKKLKKALFTPGKSKREAAAQQLMQASGDTPTSQRYSEKHTDQADGVVNYSRKTSFQDARESVQPPGPYRSVGPICVSALTTQVTNICKHSSKHSAAYSHLYIYTTFVYIYKYICLPVHSYIYTYISFTLFVYIHTYIRA